jgi:hypothetical protein
MKVYNRNKEFKKAVLSIPFIGGLIFAIIMGYIINNNLLTVVNGKRN